jgi:hypothetical protein
MASSPVLSAEPLGFPWATPDPFLFCVHHDDAYPAGNEVLGPQASLEGRDIGQDFAGLDGWRMYHGEKVPGFPEHPHRGFETITIVRRGFIDHSDSLGATARFGEGDVQWVTAGRGLVHSEMFPLRRRDAPNPVELFQLWLNLPAADKFVEPHFTMLWRDTISTVEQRDAAGRLARVTVVAGSYEGARGPTPPPHSWAARPEAHVAIWTIALEPGATWVLPAAVAGLSRRLSFFRGSWVQLDGARLDQRAGLSLRSDAAVTLTAGPDGAEFLLLQGRPIAEPVVQYGPFVMNSRAEIQQAYADYQRTRFGGWPFDRDDPVHPREQGRFAVHADGRREDRGP